VIQDFQALLDSHPRVTILAHQEANADTLGTALGIYTLLKSLGKQVEVCCQNALLTKSLDFLPHFARIKRQVDFEDSLILTCAGSTLKSFGFEFGSRSIVNIDHHEGNLNFGTLNIVNTASVSSSQVAYELFKEDFKINKSVATCFYLGLLSETEGFSTSKVTQEVFAMAAELLSYGIDLSNITQKFRQRKSLSSLRILTASLATLALHHDAEVASLIVSQQSLKENNGKAEDLEGIIDHAIALVTVEVAMVLVEHEDAIQVVFRSKNVDVAGLAALFGGSGQFLASEFISEKMDVQTVLNKILDEIKRIGLLNG